MPVTYRIVEISLFDTCNLNCGYCTCNILDTSQLIPYKDRVFIERITRFFNKRTNENEKWHFNLTGGEPLIMPNFDYFCDLLLSKGNKISINTNLSVGSNNKSFQYLVSHGPPGFDYIMASLHPECESNEQEYFNRIIKLKEAGHSVILRYVGHPKRLSRLEILARKCREVDVCFLPTTLLSTNYPKKYTADEKNKLCSYFSSLSQIIQINGGLDTSEIKCHAGSRLIGVYITTGDITPCISVYEAVIGNIFEDRLSFFTSEINCPQKNTPCICDLHFQQNIVVGIEDQKNFLKQKKGYTEPNALEKQDKVLRQKKLLFSKVDQVMGLVEDEMVLIRYRSALRKRN